MRFNIRGRQLPVTEALRDYAEKKLSRLDKYFEAPLASDAQVTLSVIKNKHVVEVTIPLPGVLLRAEERHDDMYASIDLVVDKLERQIRKHKTKREPQIPPGRRTGKRCSRKNRRRGHRCRSRGRGRFRSRAHEAASR